MMKVRLSSCKSDSKSLMCPCLCVYQGENLLSSSLWSHNPTNFQAKDIMITWYQELTILRSHHHFWPKIFLNAPYSKLNCYSCSCFFYLLFCPNFVTNYKVKNCKKINDRNTINDDQWSKHSIYVNFYYMR